MLAQIGGSVIGVDTITGGHPSQIWDRNLEESPELAKPTAYIGGGGGKLKGLPLNLRADSVGSTVLPDANRML